MRCRCSQLVYFRYPLLLIFLFFPFWIYTGKSSTIATDTLSQTGSLSDGQTLISLNNTFELGFFSPNGSSNRYVGIWYYNIPSQTPVWIANRNNPLLDTSGVLYFNNITELVIIDGRGNSYVVAYGLGRKDVEATILASGNLVLREVNNVSSILWQSFDYPTDTFLAGMKLGVVEGRNRLITSWSSSSDPATGDFSLGLDPNRTKQFFIWRKGTVYWRSGTWNGTDFTAIPNGYKHLIYNYFVSNSEGVYFTYQMNSTYNYIMRPIIRYNGQYQLLIWIDSQAEWVLFWAQPNASCDVYNICGAFGLCDDMGPSICTCLPGFEPASQSDWNNGDTSGGCVLQSKLQCATSRTNITFLATSLLKLPPNSNPVNAEGLDNCEAVCLSECNCTGYAFFQGCYVWYGDLTDLRVWTIHSNSTESVLYVRENASSIVSSGKHSQGGKIKTYIIASVSTMTFLLLCIGLIFIRKWRGRQGNRKYHDNNQQLEHELGMNGEITLWKSDDKNIQVSLYDFSYIAEATSNFSENNKLGEGGFGPVYKGCFSGGQEVAVKRLGSTSKQGLVEFKNEILLIARLQHRNLVRLIGCCVREEDKMLIYEYLPNKSLDCFIFDQIRGELLDWSKRFHIVEGIAQGLLYLHKHSRLRIIHRDLKASNILLDEEMNPKISDFGMARMFCSNETQGSTRRIVGTYGYMAPEYAIEGIFSIKSDVFSFGVLLLEIVSGLRNSGFRQRDNCITYSASLAMLGICGKKKDGFSWWINLSSRIAR